MEVGGGGRRGFRHRVSVWPAAAMLLLETGVEARPLYTHSCDVYAFTSV